MTGQFSQAVARFSATVEAALTRARRAAGEARAQSTDFRRRTGELAAQAKTGKLRGVRRDAVKPTSAEARAQAVDFRTAGGLPVEELPDADTLIARLPGRAPSPPRRPENEDFSEHTVLFDVDGRGAPAETPRDFAKMGGIDSPAAEVTRPSDAEDDFSQQRILFDATVETYRPDGMPGSVFESDEQDNRRSGA
jgi:hypothetical protein